MYYHITERSDKEWQTSEKKTQTCEKSDKNVNLDNKKWQTSEKKLINLWKKVWKSQKLL